LQSSSTGFEQGAHFTLAEEVLDFTTTLLGFNKGVDLVEHTKQ
jgi:hypothetical protein